MKCPLVVSIVDMVSLNFLEGQKREMSIEELYKLNNFFENQLNDKCIEHKIFFNKKYLNEFSEFFSSTFDVDDSKIELCKDIPVESLKYMLKESNDEFAIEKMASIAKDFNDKNNAISK